MQWSGSSADWTATLALPCPDPSCQGGGQGQASAAGTEAEASGGGGAACRTAKRTIVCLENEVFDRVTGATEIKSLCFNTAYSTGASGACLNPPDSPLSSGKACLAAVALPGQRLDVPEQTPPPQAACRLPRVTLTSPMPLGLAGDFGWFLYF